LNLLSHYPRVPKLGLRNRHAGSEPVANSVQRDYPQYYRARYDPEGAQLLPQVRYCTCYTAMQ